MPINHHCLVTLHYQFINKLNILKIPNWTLLLRAFTAGSHGEPLLLG